MSSEHRPVDEAANLFTHGLGLVLSIAATVVMMWSVVGESPSTVVARGGLLLDSDPALWRVDTFALVSQPGMATAVPHD